MTPATTIVKYLGGAKSVSLLVHCHISAVYKWTYPVEKREGKGGIIPAKYQIMLLNYAKRNNIDLRPDDFFYPERLQNLMQQKETSPTSTFTESSAINEHQQDNTPYQPEERI
ncbi:hypothetical protein [Bartonella bovis]|uniref:Uncharacterized protein n=1 Tax=Bartonella bovis m02 TaxID=1094492 RepID=N6VHF9_9HYPH|nr:hypothetical protein [Bartonella bovis]ENN93230.1 hypothetical protein m02_02360 [Bartonella bovis m02]